MINFSLILPEISLFCGALFIILSDSYLNKKFKDICYFSHIFALGSCAIASFFAVKNIAFNQMLFSEMFVSNSFTSFVKSLTILFLVLIILLSLSFIEKNKKISAEFLALLLIAAVGGMVMISSNDFLTFYLGLEMQALCLYLLAAIDRSSKKSSEAGIKYFVLGCVASGILLFGVSMIYGFSGSVNFRALNNLYQTQNLEAYKNIPVGVMFGFVMVLISLFFKIAAAPFHMWSPDVYQGSSSISTTFFASVAKFTTVLALINIFSRVIIGWPGIENIFIFVAILSLFIGSFGAIFQKNLKRLLAYSSIGHIGFILLAMASFSKQSFIACVLYMIIYVLISIATFGFVAIIKDKNNCDIEISRLSGLSKTNPAMAFALAVLMFSSAGIPPLAGFFSKFYILSAAISRGLLFWAIAAIIFSVISAFYYLRIVKIMYFDEVKEKIEFENYSNSKLIIILIAIVNILFVFLLDILLSLITNFIAF